MTEELRKEGRERRDKGVKEKKKVRQQTEVEGRVKKGREGGNVWE